MDPPQRISQQEMRHRFNAGGYWQRVLDEEWVGMVYDSHAPGPNAPKDLQEGSQSQEVHYFDRSLQRMAIVHQYLQPDGTLGASGKPDPKWMRDEDGTIYRLQRGSS